MARPSIRFSVTDDNGHRAATWKCWTQAETSDLYLSCREVGHAFKTSMHESGEWHTAYERGFFESKVDWQDDRFIEKYGKPKEIAPGFMVAHRIIVPSDAATTPIGAQLHHKLRWIPRASANKAREIDILITGLTRRINGWPGKNNQGTELVGSFDLLSGETVWIVHHEIDPPDFSNLPRTVSPRYFGDQTEADLLQSENPRALVGGTMADGSRVIYEFTVQVKKSSSSVTDLGQ